MSIQHHSYDRLKSIGGLFGLSALGAGILISEWFLLGVILSAGAAIITAVLFHNEILQFLKSMVQPRAAGAVDNQAKLAGFLSIGLIALNVSALAHYIFEGGPQKPDVALRFIYPKGPALQIINQSGVTASQIKYSVVVWDLGKPGQLQSLLIPVATFDFIRPHAMSGPIGIFSGQPVQLGMRLFGTAEVECPECNTARTYWLYVEWGKGGWYAEIPDLANGGNVVPRVSESSDIGKFADAEMAKIPLERRITIEDAYK